MRQILWLWKKGSKNITDILVGKKRRLGLMLFIKTGLDIAVIYTVFHQQELTDFFKNDIKTVMCNDKSCLNNKDTLIELASVASNTNLATMFFTAGAAGIDFGAIMQFLASFRQSEVRNRLKTTLPMMAFIASALGIATSLIANGKLLETSKYTESIPPVLDNLALAKKLGYELLTIDFFSVASSAVGLLLIRKANASL